jgi:Ca2+-binding RTX toxin-like protein
VLGGDGDDIIRANGVSDVLSGGAGDDTIYSGYLGARSVDGGAGNDRILASAIGNGGFEYSGGTGDDRISAQNNGTISMFGDEGNDTLNFSTVMAQSLVETAMILSFPTTTTSK